MKRIEFVGKRQNLWGRWQIKSADGTTHYIPVKHHTEPPVALRQEIFDPKVKSENGLP